MKEGSQVRGRLSGLVEEEGGGKMGVDEAGHPDTAEALGHLSSDLGK